MWEEKIIGDYIEKNNVFFPNDRRWTMKDVAAAMEYAIEKERERVAEILNSAESFMAAERVLELKSLLDGDVK